MEPIVLTEFGEILTVAFLRNEPADATDLLFGKYRIIGMHDVCGGTFQINDISSTYRAICCNNCNLRIVIPIEVDNYDKLRQWCAKKISIQDDGRVRLEMLWKSRVAKINAQV